MLPVPLRPLPILLGALLMGMLSFTVVAVYVAITRTGAAASPDYTLLMMLAALGPAELFVYHILFRPAVAKQARQTAASTPTSEARDLALAQQFMVNSVLAAALLEGWGLLGAVILFLNAQWPGIVAPIIAAIGIALLLDVRGRFERFKEEATGQRNA